MIETEQSISIDAPIGATWDYVQDIRRWAALFPGCRECVVIDANDSRWVLKVGAGGLVKTVSVRVHVDQWNGPEQVHFSYALEGEPVRGNGSYLASRKGPGQTDLMLKVRVEGSGPMAPMWEAVSKPLLPQLAKSFASRLKTEIEAISGAALPQEVVTATAIKPGFFSGLMAWLRNLWRLWLPNEGLREKPEKPLP